MGYRIGLQAAVAGVCAGCTPSEPLLDELLSQDHEAAYDLVERGAPILYVDSIAELQDVIGLEHTVILLATTSTDPGGNYVVPACATRAEEGVNPDCGQMTLGYGSALLGALVPELDGLEPTGNVLHAGPLIDCSALTNPSTSWDPDDGNGWRLACVAMTSGIVWGVEIDNGSVNPQVPGQGSHRNGILVKRSDGPTLVGRTKLADTRRGILHGGDTRLTVTEVLVDRAELGGVFSMNADVESDSPPKALDGCVQEIDVSSTWLNGIGNYSVLFIWAVGGDGMDATGTYRHVVVESTSRNSFVVYGNNTLDPTPITNASARVDIDDSRLGAWNFGLQFLLAGTAPGNAGNEVIADVQDVTFANASGAPVIATYAPWDATTITVGLRDTAYDGATPGRIAPACSPATAPGCADAQEPRWRLAGTRGQFLGTNDNYDISALTDAYFTGERLPR